MPPTLTTEESDRTADRKKIDDHDEAEKGYCLPVPERYKKHRKKSDTSCGTYSSETSPLLGRRHKSDKLMDDNVSDAGSDLSPGQEKREGIWKWLHGIKTAILCAIVLISMAVFAMNKEYKLVFEQIIVESNKTMYMPLASNEQFPILNVALKGYFMKYQVSNVTDIDVFLTVERLGPNDNVIVDNQTEIWREGLAPASHRNYVIEKTTSRYFDLEGKTEDWEDYSYRLKIFSNGHEPVSLSIGFSEAPRNIEYGVIYATIILTGLYVLIVFDMVHRTLAAMVCGIAALAVLAYLNHRPTLVKVVSWLDVETLCLLFGMMILVAILCETGFFDYIAVLAYKLAKGRLWTLITLLCVFTSVVSAFLDNVTTILLMTPVTIRLCEALELNPKYVLITLVIFSNIGGTATAVGDPPNVIIVSNAEMTARGIGFANFTLHMSLGSIVALFVTYGVVRIMFRNIYDLHFQEPIDVTELRKEIQVWKRTSGSMSLYSSEEKAVRSLLQQKIKALNNVLSKKLRDKRPSEEDYKSSLLELKQKYRITNYTLLIKTGIVMFFVIVLFFLHSLPIMKISLGWIAVIGSIFLLVLADLSELEHIFARVEWTTLLFFAALFVVMEALGELGLLSFIGTLVENFIKEIPEHSRLAVAIILILWVSAISSSFIDNIPFTTVMVKIIAQIGENPELNIPLYPLVWALAFGACFGGNGTLIGASANVVCAGVAEQHGYRFTFVEFFKVGFPIMLISTFVAMLYLLFCHVLFEWNYT